MALKAEPAPPKWAREGAARSGRVCSETSQLRAPVRLRPRQEVRRRFRHLCQGPGSFRKKPLTEAYRLHIWPFTGGGGFPPPSSAFPTGNPLAPARRGKK